MTSMKRLKGLFITLKTGYTSTMKYTRLLVLAVLAAAVVFFGCKKGGSSSKESNFDKDASYAIGMSMGSSLAQDDIIPDFDEYLNGIKDTVLGNKARFTREEAMEKIQTAYFAMMEKRDAETKEKGLALEKPGADLLAENSKKANITTTASGLQYEVIRDASGPKPLASDMVKVHYEGKLVDGTIFDSSYQRDEPVEFPLSEVIPGWTEGVQLMSVGSKYRLFIPSYLGYGEYGARTIPPNAVLIFEVELLDIIK